MAYLITGGKKLFGEVRVQRAKNSVLTLMAASLMVKGKVKILGCPRINDVLVMEKIIKRIGGQSQFCGDGLELDCRNVFTTSLPEKLTGEVRASFFTVGALLARFKTVTLSRPGGCNIGARPIDIHLEGLCALGASYSENNCKLTIFANKLKGTRFRLRYPSVGATENLMMAASLADGVTVLENCAREPEIKDLQKFLNACGARISGAGTGKITVFGVKKLHGDVEFTPIADRIEAGTFLLCSLACGGEMLVKGVKNENILPLMEKIKNNTCKIYVDNDNIFIKSMGEPTNFGSVVTAPYPLFPTDLQPQLAAVACAAQGKTVITETVFDNRFGYAEELCKMGAKIAVAGNVAVIDGTGLFGAKVCAKDLRGGAALTIAALKAEGDSEICGVEHLERGYEDLFGKLVALGASIRRE